MGPVGRAIDGGGATVTETPTVDAIGGGAYLVHSEGRSIVVYVAGPVGHRWVFVNGRVYREDQTSSVAATRASLGTGGPQSLTAPMPATVLKVLATPGATVEKGDTLIILEAMKMELPLRATSDGVVVAVHCREGQLVTPDAVLVELQ